MSFVSLYIDCPQCSYSKADHEYDCRTHEQATYCWRCGFCESWKAKHNDPGQVTDWEHVVTASAGALLYRPKDGGAFRGRIFKSDSEVLEAEAWLRERLKNGTIAPDAAYVSRWNADTKILELVIGTFFDWSDIPEKIDFREFQLIAARYSANVEYSCDHVIIATILLLEEQREPAAGVVMNANLPCAACSGQSGRHLLENQSLDGTSKNVSIALHHPKTTTEAADKFYAAFPQRKQYHPESIGFRLQLEGWSDEDIRHKKWLCDCSGCRATPKTTGCVRSRS